MRSWRTDQSNRWWNGPNFLWIPQLEIPALEPQISPKDPEVKKATVLATKSMEHLSLLERIAYFSNWYRTKRAIAICQLFIERMKLRAKKPSDPPIRNDMDPPLEGIRSEQQERSSKCITMTVKDLQRAELLLIKEVQCHTFPEEVKALETHRKERGEIHRRERKVTNRSSPIHRLNPILDKDGILRIGGRLSQTSLAHLIQHSVLLPKKGNLTDLIVRHFHYVQATRVERECTEKSIRQASG